jgi:hypothetical protein
MRHPALVALSGLAAAAPLGVEALTDVPWWAVLAASTCGPALTYGAGLAARASLAYLLARARGHTRDSARVIALEAVTRRLDDAPRDP